MNEKSSEEIALLPCPECGKEILLGFDSPDSVGQYWGYYVFHSYPSGECHLNISLPSHQSKNDAVREWNGYVINK